ncbi:MAG: amidohydrolase family protein [Verrucomicrobia bacterium]|nr:amidohydrolase family protein [Verrucomicrobiota bacterium]
MSTPSFPPASPVLSRREFLRTSAVLAGAVSLVRAAPAAEPITDIHQHKSYSGRPDDKLLQHQAAMGATTTVILAGGGNPKSVSALNAEVLEFVRAHPKRVYFFANARTDRPDARAEVEKYLKLGAIGIGEQKTNVPCDSRYVEILAELARDHGVPMLMHFQHEAFNTGFERFHKILEKFPTVNFIGHAQAWWGNIDKNHDQKVNYPTGKVTPGGITDRLLADYPNMWADLSAGSGNNAFVRDEEQGRGFIERHQDKLLFGTDCSDAIGQGAGCIGARQIAVIRRLAPSKAVERKVLHGNARKLLGIG